MTAADPVLSIVVAIVSDTIDPHADVSHLAGCLEALAEQVDAPPLEIIVPHHAEVDGLDALRARFPDVRFELVTDPEASATGGGREHHDVLRARGMALARGELIGLLEDVGRPDPGWCASVVAAHRDGAAAVGGAMDNGIDRPLNWSVYYCDFGKYESPVPAGPSPFASDANVTYKRSALESVRDAWQASFREVVVNGELHARGEQVVLDPAVVVRQHRSDLSLGTALKERYVWGRSYAETRVRILSRVQTLVYACAWPVLPLFMWLRLAKTARERGRSFDRFVKAAPLTLLLLVAWSLGEGVGYWKALFGR